MKTIVAPVDGSLFSEKALPYAVELAKATGARLIVLRAAPQPVSIEAVVDPVDAKFDSLDEAESELVGTVSRLGASDVTVEPHVYSGDAAQSVMNAARLNEAGLIVMATHGRSGLGRWLYGSVADEVIRASHIPVLLLPIVCESSWPADQARRILVALDGSTLAEQVLEPVVPLAIALESELMLVRMVAPGARAKSDAISAEAYLETVSKRLGAQGLRVQTVVQEGLAAAKIASLAREMDVRLVAMATHGRGGIARYMLGSVTNEVLHRATTPLLVVRPTKIDAPVRPPVESTAREEEPLVSLRVTPTEAHLLSEAVGLLLSTSQKEEHLARPLHALLKKVEDGESASARR